MIIGLELDIWRYSEDPMTESFFQVSHTNLGETTPLSYYLNELKLWSNFQKQKHDVVWITIDVKSTQGDAKSFPDELDTYLTKYFDASLIATPTFLFPKYRQTEKNQKEELDQSLNSK